MLYQQLKNGKKKRVPPSTKILMAIQRAFQTLGLLEIPIITKAY